MIRPLGIPQNWLKLLPRGLMYQTQRRALWTEYIMKQKSKCSIARNLLQHHHGPSAYDLIYPTSALVQTTTLGLVSLQAPSFVPRFPATVLPENFRTHTLVSYHPLTNNPTLKNHEQRHGSFGYLQPLRLSPIIAGKRAVLTAAPIILFVIFALPALGGC